MSWRAYGSDVSKPRVVLEPQFTGETIVAHAEVPDALRHSAVNVAGRPREAAAEDTHLLFLTAHDLPCVHRHAVGRLHLRDPIDDRLVVASRRAHQADGRAAPGANGSHGCRRLGRRLRARRTREHGGHYNAGELSFPSHGSSVSWVCS